MVLLIEKGQWEREKKDGRKKRERGGKKKRKRGRKEKIEEVGEWKEERGRRNEGGVLFYSVPELFLSVIQRVYLMAYFQSKGSFIFFRLSLSLLVPPSERDGEKVSPSVHLSVHQWQEPFLFVRKWNLTHPLSLLSLSLFLSLFSVLLFLPKRKSWTKERENGKRKKEERGRRRKKSCYITLRRRTLTYCYFLFVPISLTLLLMKRKKRDRGRERKKRGRM